MLNCNFVHLSSIALRVILWRIHLAHLGKNYHCRDFDQVDLCYTYQGRIVLMKHGILLVLLDVHGVGILLHHGAVDSLRRRSGGNLRLPTPCLSGGRGVVRCRGVGVCVW